MESKFIAHINEMDGSVQTVLEHSRNTAELSKQFAIPEFQEIAYIAGLAHDLGKWEEDFQQRIRGKAILVEHSIDGAIEVNKLLPYPIGKMLAYCIAGHHSGIPDGGNKKDSPDNYDHPTLYGRLQRKDRSIYEAYQEELQIPDIDDKEFKQLLTQDCNNYKVLVDKFAFFTRYCFSCLTDADSIDTGTFCGTRTNCVPHTDFAKCLQRLDQRMSSFVCKTELQKARSVLQEQVFAKVRETSEISLMNMPTGSGKTLCSIKFALERAIRAGKKRIIYIIPFNSIIDQTVGEFEGIFQEDAEILRHQSSFSYEDDDGDESSSEDYRDAMKNATENWDAGIVITTAVQFFESLYSNRKKKLRKLHNMADSILIFDEAHLMPQNFLQPCLQAVSFLTKYFHSEAVFLTATMPDFKSLVQKYALSNSQVVDLIEDTSAFHKFKKCRYVNMGQVSQSQLLQEVQVQPSALVIVNSKKMAKELYQLCTGNKYHLSTYMAACDRQRVIGEIKDALELLEKDFPGLQNVPEERRITIISTSLIEAGVDLDLFSVYRELTGLDSILQSGGRCNREGKRSDATTFVFSFIKNENQHQTDVRIELTRGLLEKYEDISAPECITEYYDRLFHMREDQIENHTISSECSDINCIPFRSYGERFKIIDALTASVAVGLDEKSLELIRQLEYTGQCNVRELQKYTCSIKPWELDALIDQHVVKDYGSGIWCLTNRDYYDDETGIKFEGEDYFI